MNVFIGWSGDRSKHVASVLRDWLPKVIQAVTPWMSERDIKAGARWLVELLEQLEKTHFGIIALSSDNMREPWIHFEAGALAKQVKESGVCPYLIDIADKSAVAGPLTQFQIKKANKEDTLSLVTEINQRLGDKKLADNILAETFDRWWPDLEHAIKTSPPAIAIEPKRTDRELLEEIVERVRSLDQQASEYWPPSMRSRGSPIIPEFVRWVISQPPGSGKGLLELLKSLNVQNSNLFEPDTGDDPSTAVRIFKKRAKKKNGGPEDDN
jgi:TIR domain